MFIYLDTETTGTGPDDRLCQLAFKTGQGTIVNELFNPGKPIAIEAMAVQHIANEMVKDKPSFTDLIANKQNETPLVVGMADAEDTHITRLMKMCR